MGVDFHTYLQSAKALVVQPRMGFSNWSEMRRGLVETKALDFPRVGTITLDSFTRMGRFDEVRTAVLQGRLLNGYPLGGFDDERNIDLLSGLVDEHFAVQVRHGSPLPLPVFEKMLAMGVDATEGGPVSYCLPYGRTPLEDSIRSWEEACALWAASADARRTPHLESFGGCMMGQLCPPELLVSLSILECIFFVRHGMRSVSLSYAQGALPVQDLGALRAMDKLARMYLEGAQWSKVLYTFMGLFPVTTEGARRLIKSSAALALTSGCERLVVKTEAEAHQIPNLEDNLAAMRLASKIHQPKTIDEARLSFHEEQIMVRADRIIQAVLNLDAEPGTALLKAFKRGLLDVPWCLHPDNPGLTRSSLSADGAVIWTDTGRMPINPGPQLSNHVQSSDHLLHDLRWMQRVYDTPAMAAAL